MTTFSKLNNLNIPCKAYVHPWCDSCMEASMDLLPSCVKESFRIYVVAYTVALLMRGKIPSKNEVKRTILGILQSTLFLTLHGIGFSASLCLMRRILGHFNFLTVAFLPKFLLSFLTILIERPSRRGLLSLYVTNVASETIFRMAVARKLITPIRYGEVFVFATSVSYLLYYYKGLGLPKDPVYSLLRFLVGPYEERGYFKMEESPPPPRRTTVSSDDNCFLQLHKKLGNKSSLKKFSIGWGLYLSLRIVLNFKRILTNPVHLKKVLSRRDNVHLGLCFGVFTGLFSGLSCLLRRGMGTDSEFSALPAGFLAGLAFYFYRDNTIALYFMWKTLQISYNHGVEKGILPEIPYVNVIFYAFATAVLFHVAIMEPDNLRPSYFKFLQAMSGGRLARMDRKHIDDFGLKTTESLARALARSPGVKPPSIEIKKT